LLAISITGTVRVNGVVGVSDAMLVRGAEVDITVPLAGGGTTVLQGQTNAQGVYTITRTSVTAAASGTFSGQVFARAPVQGAQVPLPYQVQAPGTGTVYQGSLGGAPTGSAGAYTWTSYIVGSPAEKIGAFQVFTTLFGYYDYAKYQLYMPDNNRVNVQYPTRGNSEFVPAQTQNGPCTMLVGLGSLADGTPGFPVDRELIGHEFGHYAAYEFARSTRTRASTTNSATMSAITWARRRRGRGTCGR